MKTTEKRKFGSFKINKNLSDKLNSYKENFLQLNNTDLKSEIDKENEHMNNVDRKSKY
jgi:hypothetical protein